MQNLSILSIAYYTKIESALFRYDFVEQLKKIEKPPGGNVQIISSHMPGYLRQFEVSYYFFKAYGQSSWWGEVVRDGKIRENFKPEELHYATKDIDIPKYLAFSGIAVVKTGENIEEWELVFQRHFGDN